MGFRFMMAPGFLTEQYVKFRCISLSLFFSLSNGPLNGILVGIRRGIELPFLSVPQNPQSDIFEAARLIWTQLKIVFPTALTFSRVFSQGLLPELLPSWNIARHRSEHHSSIHRIRSITQFFMYLFV